MTDPRFRLAATFGRTIRSSGQFESFAITYCHSVRLLFNIENRALLDYISRGSHGPHESRRIGQKKKKTVRVRYAIRFTLTHTDARNALDKRQAAAVARSKHNHEHKNVVIR